jgi:hypothetical protein
MKIPPAPESTRGSVSIGSFSGVIIIALVQKELLLSDSFTEKIYIREALTSRQPSALKTQTVLVQMCEAVALPVHFGVVGVMFAWPLLGQSRLRCLNSLHLKNLPSFMRCVRSLSDMQLMSMALGSFFSGKENFFCAGGALGVFAGLSCFLKRHGVQRKSLWPLCTTLQVSLADVLIR